MGTSIVAGVFMPYKSHFGYVTRSKSKGMAIKIATETQSSKGSAESVLEKLKAFAALLIVERPEPHSLLEHRFHQASCHN